nr:hypothetical protein Csa_3G103570 [Ipomoea trifida]
MIDETHREVENRRRSHGTMERQRWIHEDIERAKGSQPKPLQILGRISPIPLIRHRKLRRFDVAEHRNNPLPALHHQRQLVQAEIRVAILRRQDRHPDLTSSDRGIDLVEQLVPRLHVLAVQERPQPRPPQVVVKQPRHVLLRVDPPVVHEHVARRPPEVAFPDNLAAGVLGCGQVTLHGRLIN